jgi:hypothetical protein
MFHKIILDLPSLLQKDGYCGPYALTQIFNYYRYQITPEEVISQNARYFKNGSLDGYLGALAIEKGFQAILMPFNINIYDPSWKDLPSSLLSRKLQKLKKTKDQYWQESINSHLFFLNHGGQIKFPELTPDLIYQYLKKKIPLLTSLCITALYQEPKTIAQIDPRTRKLKLKHDEFTGNLIGHFCVVHGVDLKKQEIYISDPWHLIPQHFSKTRNYKVSFSRFLTSLLYGTYTRDASLIAIFK